MWRCSLQDTYCGEDSKVIVREIPEVARVQLHARDRPEKVSLRKDRPPKLRGRIEIPSDSSRGPEPGLVLTAEVIISVPVPLHAEAPAERAVFFKLVTQIMHQVYVDANVQGEPEYYLIISA